MKFATVAATALLLMLSSGAARADIGDAPIAVTPDQFVVRGHQVFLSVVAVNTPLGQRPRHASLIIYKPDGTVLMLHRRTLRNSAAVFRVYLGSIPTLGPYTVFATVEVDSQAFGMPTAFDVVE
jgi:hypothetical protein